MSNHQFNLRGGAAVGSMRGTSLIEVLVTIVILAIGLLGMAGLEARLQSAEMEAYQRAQALILVDDMASRIATNRTNAATYAANINATTGVGAGACPASNGQRWSADINEWCSALQGAGETATSGKVGAMVAGRGCVENLGNGEYLVTVAWQGLQPISAPPASVACGLGFYGANDALRRTVTTVVRIADLAT